MHRFTFFALLFATVAAFGQNSAPFSGTLPQIGTDSQPISEQVAAAEAAIVKSDWTTAKSQLDPWLVAHPTDARALFDAGYVADAQKRLDDAVGLFRRAIEANPQSFEAHAELGMILARQTKFTEARTVLAAATQLDAGSAGDAAKARVWRALAQIDRAGDAAKASEDLLEALKLSPETLSDKLLAASLAEQTGQYEAAETAYHHILAADPSSAPANAGLAHLLIARKQYPEAETLLRTALSKSPDDPALTAQLATVLAIQNKAEALTLFQKLHDAHPNDDAITRMLADVLAQAGDAAASDKLDLALLGASPDNSYLLMSHGQNMIRLLNYTAAFTAFDKATRLDSANAEGWSGLAFAASKLGQPNVTLHALTMRSKYLAEVPSTYYLWATAYDTLHDKAQAATYYHHFLDAAAGKYPNQESQARQRLFVLEGKK